ncbi:Vacuolar protein sorting-associated protein 52 [Fasciola gigantica]|uniref:Vacuolar protein sorting-associated protein 52 homolog n=1 Tax=Fasciola gigantica TaxID=46835 RepID=A0A504YUI9_FASGI|nr:Vacuolar protein sorting-associated protein 52 [Fasciola gigantica]
MRYSACGHSDTKSGFYNWKFREFVRVVIDLSSDGHCRRRIIRRVADGTGNNSTEIGIQISFSDDICVQNVDLREYASQVDAELVDLEETLMEKYISVGPEVAKLHKQITSCDSILERMEVILSNFHKDLGTISSEIQDLQMKSSVMNKRLQNRQVRIVQCK